MNGFAKNATSCLAGLSPATAMLSRILQTNERSFVSDRNSYRSSVSSNTKVNGKPGRSQSNRFRFDEQLMSQKESSRSRLRVALYSHDTMGLGHLRRNLLIAQALAESPLQATTLLITGAHEANFFALPAGADFLTLPRMHKDQNGQYTAGQLAIAVEDLVCLRAESIRSALDAFRPEVMIVDKVPCGAFGEMLPALQSITEKYDTQCVLGIRDVLDEAKVVRSEWLQSSHEVIDAFYDELWVYGDQRVYDPIKEYGWPQNIAGKVRYTGYLDQAKRQKQSPKASSQNITFAEKGSKQRIVCTLGGGQDGFQLAETFIDALPNTGAEGILLTGPFMPPHLLRSIQERVAQRTNVRVMEFTPEADQLISRADRVVAMGGYNTVCEILSYRKPSLLVPRVSPRKEQWIRAQRLQQLGILDMIHPDELTVTALRDWIEKDVSQPRIHPDVIDFTGLDRIARLVTGLVERKTTKRKTTNRKNCTRDPV